MIELRWLERDVPGPRGYAYMERVLQYRNLRIYITADGQVRMPPNGELPYDWTEWQDVPTVSEVIPGR